MYENPEITPTMIPDDGPLQTFAASCGQRPCDPREATERDKQKAARMKAAPREGREIDSNAKFAGHGRVILPRKLE